MIQVVCESFRKTPQVCLLLLVILAGVLRPVPVSAQSTPVTPPNAALPQHFVVVRVLPGSGDGPWSPLMTLQSGTRIPKSDFDAALTVKTLDAPQQYKSGRASLFVLKTRAVEDLGTGHMRITNASGATFDVPSTDLNTEVAQWLTEPNPIQLIQRKCEQEWPTDFRMQAYCQQRATAAGKELAARTMDTPDRQTIRVKCFKDWPTDFVMRNYCEKQQLEALRQLGR